MYGSNSFCAQRKLIVYRRHANRKSPCHTYPGKRERTRAKDHVLLRKERTLTSYGAKYRHMTTRYTPCRLQEEMRYCFLWYILIKAENILGWSQWCCRNLCRSCHCKSCIAYTRRLTKLPPTFLEINTISDIVQAGGRTIYQKDMANVGHTHARRVRVTR